MSIDEVVDSTYSPWEEEVYLDGTDGMQFQPTLKDDLILGAFVNDLSRNCYFEFNRNDKKTYDHYNIKIFLIQTDLMYNMTANPANENF